MSTFRLFAVSMVVLSLLLFSCEDRLAAYYPLAVGNKWVYKTTYHDTGEVVTSHDVIVHKFENSYKFANGAQIVHLKNNSFIDNSGVILTYPMQEGYSWKIGGKKAVYTSVDKTVVVPAGTFYHCIEVSIQEKKEEALFFATIVYAPDVGPVMMEYFKIENGKRTPLFTSELVEYQVKPEEKPAGCW